MRKIVGESKKKLISPRESEDSEVVLEQTDRMAGAGDQRVPIAGTKHGLTWLISMFSISVDFSGSHV